MIAVRTPPRASHVRRVAVSILLLGAVGFAAFVGYWVSTGGRWFIVETPSMGTSAPVGTLLWVKPVHADELHPGEFITFRPPGSSTTYSHRILTIAPNGQIRTKGQVTAPDPWRITAKDIVGKVEMRWWGLGWLVKAVPLLVLGFLALSVLVRRFVAHRWKLPAAVIGTAVLASLAIVVYRPLTRAVQLSAASTAGGGRAAYISTGLLPLRLQAAGGGHTDIHAGEVGVVTATRADAHGRYPVALHPHVPLWFWITLVAVCFVPALWTTVFGSPSRPRPRHRAAHPA